MVLWKKYPEKPKLNEMIIVLMNEFIYRGQFIQMSDHPHMNYTKEFVVLFSDPKQYGYDQFRNFFRFDAGAIDYWMYAKDFPFPDQTECIK